MPVMIFLIVLGGCGSSPSLPDDNGQAIAESFLTRIRSGQMDEAWQNTTPEFKSLMGRESFRDFVRKRPFFKETPKFQGSKPLENQALKLVECQFSVDRPKAGPIRVVLAPSGSTWQVERLIVD